MKVRDPLRASRLAWLPLLAALATLASCGMSENALAPTPKKPDQPQTGRILIPPLSGAAATRQEAFCARICEALPKARWEARAFTDAKEARTSLRYRFFQPLSPGRSRTNLCPLVLFLHGGGGTRRFEDLLQCASPVFSFGPARFVSPEEQVTHPAFVVVPWSESRGWDDLNTRLVLGLITALGREFPIDAKRIYVTGQSMGGFGVWRMITQHGDVFAAGIPVCGGGDPADAPKAKDVAVWAFHGTADGIVPPASSREMIAALIQGGGKPVYWEYDGGTHAKTAERAYCEPTLLDWLFAQKKQ